MGIQKVAVIFDDWLRPDTTGVHCRRAFRELVEVVHFHPDQHREIPPTGFDPAKDRRIDEKLAPAIQDAVWSVVSTHPLAGVRTPQTTGNP